MPTVSTYLNFEGRTERAFAFYKAVFGTEYAGPIHRIRDLPPTPGKVLGKEQGERIAHMALPILGGHLLMGTDVPKVAQGNNVSVHLRPDTREEGDRLFAALSKDGEVVMPLADQFWGAYFGQLVDPFGVQWLIEHVPATGAA